MKNHQLNNFLSGFLLLAIYLYSSVCVAALHGDSQWLVEKGDSVYSISRNVFPDDEAKRRQFRQELVKVNPAVFAGNANQLKIGDQLVLPGLVVSQPVVEKSVVEKPVVEKVVLAPVQAVTVESVAADPEEIIGRVVISRGIMQASNRGVSRKLLRHSNIVKGDTLITSANSYTQIRMKDGALISLRPKTKLVITEYNFNGKEDGSERGFFELVRGGFRTITGFIGHRNKQNYHVKTNVATIGIRGTHYGLMICAEGSCNEEAMGLQDGVYGGVIDGSIVVKNEAGEFIFNNDQYFHVASLKGDAIEQLLPPPVFHGKVEKTAGRDDSKTMDDKGETKKGEKNRVSGTTVRGEVLGSLVRKVINDAPRPVLPTDKTKEKLKDIVTSVRESGIEEVIPGATGDKAPNGAGVLVAFNNIDASGAVNGTVAAVLVSAGSGNSITLGSLSDIGNVTVNNIPLAVREESAGVVRTLILPSGVSGITAKGGDGIGVNWGRWSSDFIFTEDGTAVTTKGNLHYIYSDKITAPSRLAALGGLGSQVTYALVGGTTPTNAIGQEGSLTSISIAADFLKGNIDYQIAGKNGAAVFLMGANGVTFQNMSDFNLTDFGCDRSCEGGASAAFIGNSAEGVITTYSIQEIGGDNGLNGAALLAR